MPQDIPGARYVNALVYGLRGDGPIWVALLGFDGTYTNQDGSAASTGNPALHIKPAAGVPCLLLESSTGTDLLLVEDTGVSIGPLLVKGGNSIRLYDAANTDYVQLTGDSDGGLVLTGSGTHAGRLYLVDGTAGLPGISAASDIDTGVRFPSSNRMWMVAGGSDVMQVANTGSVQGVGVGVAPSVIFHVSGTLAADWIAILEQTSNTAGRKGVVVKSASTTAADAAFQVEIAGTPALRVFGDGTTTIGGAATLTAGQLVFPVSQNASTGANTLDDYEEGSWTPTVGATTETGTGGYTKVGRTVIAWGTLIITTIGAGSTGTISGLPFQADLSCSGVVSLWQNFSVAYVYVGTQVASGASTLTLGGATAATVTLTGANPFQSTSVIRFQITYRTAS